MRFTSRTSLAVSLVLAGTLSALVTSACGSTPEPAALPDAAIPRPTGPGPGPTPAADASEPDAGALVGLPPPATPPPAPKPDELTEPFGIFVTTTGAPDGAGTRADPLSTMSAGITKAKTEKKRLYVCAGTYAEALTLEDGVSVVANLDCTTPTAWKLGGAHAVLASPTSPALIARNIRTPTRVDGLDVLAPAGTEAEPSSIAFLAVDAVQLTLTTGKLEAQAGRNGVDGVNPAETRVDRTLYWRDPAASQPDADCVLGNGMLCNVGVNLHVERAGELGGFTRCMSNDQPAPTPGAEGVDFAATRGGQGHGSGSWAFPNIELDKASSQTAGTAAGPAPTNGVSSTGGRFAEAGFLVGSGSAGSLGAAGASGSGQGIPLAAGGQRPPSFPDRNRVRWAANGGAGGAGGCPGRPGTAGTGGGASLAAVLFRSPIRFQEMTLGSGLGGAGGQGTFGTAPTGGQTQGGAPISVSCPTCAGAGLPGGAAGVSGHGAGGPSIGIVHDKTGKPTLVSSPITHGAAGASPPEATGLVYFGQPARTIPAAARAQELNILEL